MSIDLCDIYVEIQRCYNDSTTWRSRGDHVDVFAGLCVCVCVCVCNDVMNFHVQSITIVLVLYIHVHNNSCWEFIV